MTLSVNALPFSEFVAKIPQAKIAKVISVLLLIYIAYLCAQITWQFVVPANSASSQGNQNQSISKQQPAQRVDIDRITALNLFGKHQQVQQAVQEVVQDAPQTRLKLTLSGVVASSEPASSAAIIEYQGNQETYGIGDKITGTRASLSQVYADRVIIKLSGRLETLMLDGVDFNKSVPVTKPSNNSATNKVSAGGGRKAAVIDNRNKANLAKSTRDIKSTLASEPGKITDFLRISPNQTQGKITGYQLRPGKKPEFFQAAGLKSGDIAKQINGLDLTNAAQAAQALAALRSEQEISLLVDRNGELTEILFSIEN